MANLRANRILLLIWLTGTCAVITGCGLFRKPPEELPAVELPDPATLPQPSGGQVLSISGEVITVDEIAGTTVTLLRPQAATVRYDEFAFHVRPHVERVVQTRISEALVYQQAKREAGNEMESQLKSAVENEVRLFVAGFDGDYAAAERTLAEQGLTWEAFRRQQRRHILTQVYISKKIGEPKPVTRGDLLAFYNRVKDELYAREPSLEFSVIDINPDRLEVEPDEDPREVAAGIVVDILSRLHAGEDFAELAGRHARSRRDQGGRWEPVPTGSLAPPWNAIEQACLEMDPGEISGPIVSGEYIFIVKLHDKNLAAYEPFEKVQQDVERRLAMDRRIRRFDAVMAGQLDTSRMGDIDSFVDACVLATYRQLQRQLEAQSQ